MNQSISPIIKPNELASIIHNDDLVIVDTSNGKGAKENYNASHIDGALYVDLNTQLADIKPDVSIGGRHPLPTLTQFSKTLTSLGITPTSHVVVYDDKNGANAAARLWWMLKAIGHNKVQVLDGGIVAAANEGLPFNAKVVSPKIKDPYKIDQWKLPTASISEIDHVAQDKNYLVIDVRDSDRFKGIHEPIDLIAGHIPGAKNIPFTTNLDKDGFYLSPEQLKEKYSKDFGGRKPDQVIVHCGSGVTACHTLLAVAYAGMDIPKLYVGSWSEWSRNNRAIGRE